MAVPLETVVKQLADSGIISAGKLENFVPPQAHPKSVDELVAELVKQNHLTPFQAAQVKAGKVRALMLGAYTILDRIGAGGMGQVFKAQHRKMDRTVAIKMLPNALMKDATAAARFEREVRAAAKLRHPNIVAADDAAEANGVHFLVMEYVDGKDLSALVKKNGPYPLAKALNYILQAARGLEFAHSEGVIHRDIKPANLLLDKKGVVKILDMGLARLDNPTGDAATQAELTGTGAVMGTIDYMAPEQALNTKHADKRADIYSLGITLYYLLAGKAAYDGDTIMEKLLAHREQPIPSLKEVQAGMPDNVQAVFARLVAKKKEDRYQTITEVVADLESCQSAISGTALAAGSSAPGTSLAAGSPGLTATSATLKTSSSSATEESELTVALGSRRLQAIPAVEPYQEPDRKGPPRKNIKLLAGAGAAGFLFVLLGVIVIVRDKDGKEVARLEVPDGSSVEVQPTSEKADSVIPVNPITTPNAIAPMPANSSTAEADRRAAEWVLNKGGKVVVLVGNSKPQQVTKADGLPSGAFTLREIDLSRNSSVDDGLACVQGLASLTKLSFHSTPVSVDGLTVLKDLPLLNDLDLNATGLTDDGLAAITHLKRLRRLDLAGNNRFTEKGLASLKAFPQLQDLSLAYDGVTDAGLRQFASLQEIDSLELTNAQITDAGVLELQQMSKLRFLGLSGAKGLSDAACKTFAKLAALKDLILTETNVTDAGLEHLQVMQNPRLLVLNRSLVTETGLRRLQQALPKCRISAGDPHLADAVVKSGGKVTISMQGQVHADIRDLKQLPSDFFTLVEIDLDGVKTFNNDQWSIVRRLLGLRKLVLSRTNCADGQLSYYFDDFPQLETLLLADTSLADKAAERLTKFPRLRSLDMSGTQISDVGLRQFAEIKNLTSLDLRNTKVTSTAVAALKKALPNCKIEWDDPTQTLLPPLESGRRPNEGPKPWSTPAFLQWTKTVRALPAELQVKAVGNKLKELNPGFDGKLMGTFGWTPTGTPKIESGVVTELGFFIDSVTDISPVRALVGLRSLRCQPSSTAINTGLSDLSPLQGMLLTNLNCIHAARIGDLSPLQGMPLTFLDIYGTQVSDLSPLRGMPLTKLDCYGTQVSDLSPLQGMKLTSLGCGGAKVTDLSALHGMHLTNFYCQASLVSDLLPLKGMPLVIVDFHSTPVSDLSPLRGMSLTSLNCDGTKVSDLSPLKAMPLTTLNCGGTQVTDLSPLQGMLLTTLNCDRTKISDLSPLQGMPLTTLTCYSTGVFKLQPLAGMKLTNLVCSDTKISDLSPLRGMPLGQLGIAFTPIPDLSPLQGMPLTDLGCNNTGIASLSPLKGMPLKVLDCSDTSVSDLSPLQQAPLTSLNCLRTGISDLSPLKGKRLATLNCYGTRVSDLAPLAGMPLANLNLYGTPVADFSLLASLPGLTSLDLQLTKATAAEITALRKAWPNCKIEGPITTLSDPGFQQWLKDAAALPAEKQIDAVAKKMQELNPAFDGKLTGADGKGTPKIEKLVVTEIGFDPTNVADISPLQALAGLKVLQRAGGNDSKLFDLSPLKGLKLTELNCHRTQVSDLSPLVGMPLKKLDFGITNVVDVSPLHGMKLDTLEINGKVADLSPLEGMPLTRLACTVKASDLSPLKGMPLTIFNCAGSQVTDLSPLKGMPLADLNCSGSQVTDLSPLQGMRLTNLKCIGTGVFDLAPLKGLPLTGLDLSNSQVSDLTPLQGMPLTVLLFGGTNVMDLSPLRGMPLTQLQCPRTQVSDLSPLLDCKTLKTLQIAKTKVTPAGVAALQKVLPNCKIEWDAATKPMTQ